MNPEKGNPHEDPLDHLSNILRRSIPLLNDPGEITEKVMRATDHLKRERSHGGNSHGRGTTFLLYAQRLLTAASVCLLIWYGIEEYRVLSKVRSLEQRMATIGMNPAATVTKRMVQHGPHRPSVRQFLKDREYLVATRKNLVPPYPESTINHFNR